MFGPVFAKFHQKMTTFGKRGPTSVKRGPTLAKDSGPMFCPVCLATMSAQKALARHNAYRCSPRHRQPTLAKLTVEAGRGAQRAQGRQKQVEVGANGLRSVEGTCAASGRHRALTCGARGLHGHHIACFACVRGFRWRAFAVDGCEWPEIHGGGGRKIFRLDLHCHSLGRHTLSLGSEALGSSVNI